MNAKNTNQLVTGKINFYLDAGFTSKDEIVTMIVEEFGLARSIVRRLMNDMKVDYQRKARVLDKLYQKDMKHHEGL